jgi:hypothetical protein
MFVSSHVTVRILGIPNSVFVTTIVNVIHVQGPSAQPIRARVSSSDFNH